MSTQSNRITSARRSLLANLGAWGCKTSELEGDADICWVAAVVFGFEAGDLVSTANRVDQMSKKARRAAALANVPKHFPEPSALWPAEARARGATAQAGKAKETERPISDMMEGAPVYNKDGKDLRDLLRKVVVAVINAGRGDILWEFPDVLLHFGGRIPEGYIVVRDEKTGRNEMVKPS